MELQKQIGDLGITLARMEGKLDALPCSERKNRYDALDTRVSVLDSCSNQTKGALSALKGAWSLGVIAVISLGSLALQIIRIIMGK
jgi:hypothetical protein